VMQGYKPFRINDIVISATWTKLPYEFRLTILHTLIAIEFSISLNNRMLRGDILQGDARLCVRRIEEQHGEQNVEYSRPRGYEGQLGV